MCIICLLYTSYSLDADSFIMDTPGFSAIEFNDVSLERLPTLFPEFGEYVDTCKFNPCYHEPVSYTHL